MRLYRVFLVAGLLLCITSLANAASPGVDDSVEARVATADVVVLGSVRSVATADPPGLAPSGGKWQRVTLSVDKTFRGPVGSRVTFFVRANSPGWEVPAWLGSPKQAVFCLVSGSRVVRDDPDYAFIPLTQRLLSWSLDCGPIPLDPGPGEALLSARLAKLNSRDEILSAVRSFSTGPVQPLWCTIVVPPSALGGLSGRGGSLLTVPRDWRMQAIARQWASSPDEMLRWSALRVLASVPGASNAQAVLAAANAPIESSDGPVIQEFALDILQRWKMLPAGQTLSRGREMMQPLAAVSLLALPVPAILYVLRARRLRRLGRGRGVRPGRVAILLLLSLVSILWMRSYIDGDGLAGGHWEIACLDGRFCIGNRSRFDVAYLDPWRFCRADELATATDLAAPYRYQHMTIGPWFWGAGMESWGQECYPIWTWQILLAIPFWAIVSTICAPMPVLAAWKFVWRWKRRNLRGFPVELRATST